MHRGLLASQDLTNLQWEILGNLLYLVEIQSITLRHIEISANAKPQSFFSAAAQFAAKHPEVKLGAYQ